MCAVEKINQSAYRETVSLLALLDERTAWAFIHHIAY